MQIRGLLCSHCNQRFLGRHNDATLFRSAADYLEKPRKGWLVPKKKRKRKRSPSANKKKLVGRKVD